MIEIKKIEYADRADFLNSLDLVSPSAEWRNFLARQYGARPDFLGVWENGQCQFIVPAYRMNTELAGVPKLYTEPLVCNESAGDFPIAEFMEYLRTETKAKWCRFDFAPILDPARASVLDQAQLKRRGVAHVLKLNGQQSEKEILSTVVSHKTRNQVRTAYRRGSFQLEINNEIDAFYTGYHRHIARLGGQPKEKTFFTNLHSSFGGNLKIISAKVDGAVAGANLCLLHNHYLHLLFSVSDARFFKDYINDWLYWETIKLGLAANIRIFDFGPSTLNDRSHQHFKAGFGAQPLPLYRIVVYHSFVQQTKGWVNTKIRNLGLRLRKRL